MGHRRLRSWWSNRDDLAQRRTLGVIGAVVLVTLTTLALARWLGGDEKSEAAARSTTDSTASDDTVIGKNRLGCPVLSMGQVLREEKFNDVTYRDPTCNESAALVRYCGVGGDDLLVPPEQRYPTPDRVIRSYSLRTTPVPAQVTTNPDGSVFMWCPNGNRPRFNFTKAEWDELTRPVGSDASTPRTTEPRASDHAASKPASEEDGDLKAALRPDGLGIVEFGSDAEEALSRLREEFGSPLSDRPEEFCPSGIDRSVSWGALTVEIDGDQFVGYALGPIGSVDENDKTVGLATEGSVTVGDTLAELEQAHGPVRVDDLGEFYNPFRIDTDNDAYFGGTVTGPAPTDTVMSIVAGAFCGE